MPSIFEKDKKDLLAISKHMPHRISHDDKNTKMIITKEFILLISNNDETNIKVFSPFPQSMNYGL